MYCDVTDMIFHRFYFITLWAICLLLLNNNSLHCVFRVWHRDQEAAVMRANSWLYHYYMVQSKLQYGMQFEAQTSPRVPSTGPAQAQPPPSATPVYAYHHQQSPHQQDGAYPSADHQHHQQHHQQQHQQHHHHQQQQQQQQQPVHFHQLPDGYFRYAAGAATPTGTAAAATTGAATTTTPVASKRHRLEPEPVDYSIHSPEQTPPLKIEDGGHSMASDSPPSPPSMGGGDSGGGCATAAVAALSSSLPSATSLGRSRALVKAAMDPGDLMMETWNPSPPWSDCCSGTGALQKVPDVDMLGGGGSASSYCGQPTPPTPGSGGSYHAPSGAPQQHHGHHHHPGGCDEVPTADALHHHHHHHHHHQPSTFTFDWPGEQYVPNVHEVLVEPTPHYIVPFPPWPHTAAADHHRLFPLQPPPPGSLNRPSLIVRVDQDAAAADASVQGKRTFPHFRQSLHGPYKRARA
ncbi:neuronal PAS domain-containing protein 4A [Aphis craccivora]|uniref:Neuronal PAS domain-containing protein 4A n=1 Tax=Aphis craccivora TaxID=307492 RepID=A0A6G0ZDB0_APHCR|nr:neuronal PAS domain-containing protein 4A [Aphis craccivora]